MESAANRFHFHEGRALGTCKELPLKPDSCTHLLITKGHIIYQKRGDRSFPSVQPYTRQGNTPRIVSADTTPADPGLVTIAFLEAHHLVLRLHQPQHQVVGL